MRKAIMVYRGKKRKSRAEVSRNRIFGLSGAKDANISDASDTEDEVNSINKRIVVLYIVGSLLFISLLLPLLSTTAYTKISIFLSESSVGAMIYLLQLLVLSITFIVIYHFHKKARLKDEFKLIEIDPKIEYIQKTIKSLNHSIEKYNTIGMVALSISVFGLIVFGTFVFSLFANVFEQIKDLDKEIKTIAIVVYILRTSLLGTFVVTFIVYSFKFTTSSFDQAVRFTKRKHASLFLIQMIRDVGVDDKKIGAVMDSFREWNLNVESAYTDIKLNDKVSMYLFEKMGKMDEAAFDIVKSSIKSKKSSGTSADD